MKIARKKSRKEKFCCQNPETAKWNNFQLSTFFHHMPVTSSSGYGCKRSSLRLLKAFVWAFKTVPSWDNGLWKSWKTVAMSCKLFLSFLLLEFVLASICSCSQRLWSFSKNCSFQKRLLSKKKKPNWGQQEVLVPTIGGSVKQSRGTPVAVVTK